MNLPITRSPLPSPSPRRNGAGDNGRTFVARDHLAPPPLTCLFGMAKAGAESLYRHRLREHGLTPTQWMILTALWRTEGMCVGELVQVHGAKAPALSRALSRMERNGLVERRRERADRRIVRIYLTPKARGLAFLHTLRAEVNARLLAGFTTEERQSFVSLLRRVIANLETNAADAAEGVCEQRDLLR